MYYYGKKKKSIKKKLLISFFILILVISLIFCYLYFYVNPTIIATNKAVVKANTITVINDSVKTTLDKQELYDELVSIKYDNDGNIQAIIANTSKINQLSTQILSMCNDAFTKQGLLYFDIPFGTFTGITILNNIGPNIRINILPIGNIESNFKINFKSAGINQTLHQLYINLNCNVSILLPAREKNISVSCEILVAESVIIGKVPDVYFAGGSIINDTLDLIP